MNAKPKNLFIGALATLTLGAFGTPFILSSNASTFSETPSHSERWILQVSDDDSRMDRTERSVTESSTDRPNAMERHEEHEVTRSENGEEGEETQRTDRQVTKMHSNVGGSIGMIRREHQEKQRSERSEDDD